jgi:fatty acid desaturase
MSKSDVIAAPARRPALWRHADGALPNTLALGWMLSCWIASLAMLVSGPGWLRLAGTLTLAHAMILSAYFLHEFAHHSIFRNPAVNRRWGEAMSWLAGSAYARFDDLRHKHMRHHVDRADIITFDVRRFLREGPAWLRRLVLACEWAHIPAVEVLMHGYVIVQPFIVPERRDRRARVLGVLALRLSAFALLAWASVWALLGYGIAWLLMVTVLRYADAYQHTYEGFSLLDAKAPVPPVAPGAPPRDAAYEQHNTYSNLVSTRWPWLNLLLLNFAFHNAHHERPIEPWYRLPALHAALYPEAAGHPEGHAQTLPMARYLRSYHRHRLSRVLEDDYGVVGSGPDRADGFRGAYGVSFLTAV